MIKSQLLCQLSYAPACEENASEGQGNYIIALAPTSANLSLVCGLLLVAVCYRCLRALI
jgi:hypothetical protein